MIDKQSAIKKLLENYENINYIPMDLRKDKDIIDTYWSSFKKVLKEVNDLIYGTCSIVGIDDWGNKIIDDFKKSELNKLDENISTIQFIKTSMYQDKRQFNVINFDNSIYDIQLCPLLVLIGEKENTISKHLKNEYGNTDNVGMIEIYSQDTETNNLKFISKDVSQIIHLLTILSYKYSDIKYLEYVVEQECIDDKYIRLSIIKGNLNDILHQIKSIKHREENEVCVNYFVCNDINKYICNGISKKIFQQIGQRECDYYRVCECNVDDIEIIMMRIGDKK